MAQILEGNRIRDEIKNECKPRVEKIVAEGRRSGNNKQIVTPLQSRIRDFFLMIIFRLFGEKSLDWTYSYKIDWN